jgi:hypothetical protein
LIIISVDCHPSDQYIAFVDTETGECGERQLNHSDREAEKFYRELAQRGVSVCVGMEVTGYSRWFERLLAELGIEVWIGDAAEIKTKRVRKQKTDREDADLVNVNSAKRARSPVRGDELRLAVVRVSRPPKNRLSSGSIWGAKANLGCKPRKTSRSALQPLTSG